MIALCVFGILCYVAALVIVLITYFEDKSEEIEISNATSRAQEHTRSTDSLIQAIDGLIAEHETLTETSVVIKSVPDRLGYIVRKIEASSEETMTSNFIKNGVVYRVDSIRLMGEGTSKDPYYYRGDTVVVGALFEHPANLVRDTTKFENNHHNN